MSNLVHQTIYSGVTNLDDISLSPLPADILEELDRTVQLNQNPDFSGNLQQCWSPFNNSNPTDSNQFLEDNFNVPSMVAASSNMKTNDSQLEIIAQPSYGKKLRYRCDYAKNDSRLNALKNTNENSNYKGPAIRIPQKYLHNSGEYFVRVTLITVKHNTTDRHYIHPYELEDPIHKQFNQRNINSVYFPIENEDCQTGIKCFSTLRIIKSNTGEVKAYGNFHVYNDQYLTLNSNLSVPQLENHKDTIIEYKLDQTILAFTIVRQYLGNNGMQVDVYTESTVFSHIMTEGEVKGKETETEQDTQLIDNESVASASPPLCRVYKYAPRYGFDTSEEDMVIFLTHKLEPRKYGDLQISFECDTANGRWVYSLPKDKIEIKDRMVSIKTPIFSNSIEQIQSVDINLKQQDRPIETIKYFYLSTSNSCFKCQLNELPDLPQPIQNIPTKRIINTEYVLDVPVSIETPSPSLHLDNILDILTKSISDIFIDNDFSDFYRLCRGQLREKPELLHTAIEKNNIDVLIKSIPLSLNSILQLKNSNGETALLHAIRLNRIEIVQALLNKSKSEPLINDVDNEQNNIFHLIALHSKSLEIFNLLNKYLEQNKISIQNTFDRFNKDQFTPLQCTILKNNQIIMKLYLKYFRRDVCRTKDFTGDNLVHLAVRYGDLDMIKYLIENEDFNQLANQSNLKSTPKQLAQSLKRDDLVEYFEKKYPEPIVEDTKNDSDNEDH